MENASSKKLLFLLLLPWLVDSRSAILNTRGGVIKKNCGFNEQNCWQHGQLPNGEGACFEPLYTGPCPEHHWFVLNNDHDSLQGYCLKRPCPEGQIPYSGRCLDANTVQVEACGGGPVYLDVTGQVHCGEVPSTIQRLHNHVTCKLTIPDANAKVVWVGGLPCATNDMGDCVREVIIEDKSERIISAE